MKSVWSIAVRLVMGHVTSGKMLLELKADYTGLPHEKPVTPGI